VAFAVGGLSIQTASTNGDMVWVFSLNGSPGDRLKPFDPPPPPPSEVSYNFTGLLKGAIAIEKTNIVKIIDYNYAPLRITVAAGTKVTFNNTGTQPHNAAGADAGGWDTGLLAKGETASVTFNQPGTYNFTCTPHPSMIGQVIVTGPAVGSAPAVVVESAGKPTAGAMPMPAGAH
jgi:plastocyanin